MSNNHSGNIQNEVTKEEHDGQVNAKKSISVTLATIIQTSGSNTFVGEALPGTATISSLWRAQKVDTNGNVTWADGNSDFDNAATDLSSLNYT